MGGHLLVALITIYTTLWSGVVDILLNQSLLRCFLRLDSLLPCQDVTYVENRLATEAYWVWVIHYLAFTLSWLPDGLLWFAELKFDSIHTLRYSFGHGWLDLRCVQVFLRLFFLFLSLKVLEVAPHVTDLLFILEDRVCEFCAGSWWTTLALIYGISQLLLIQAGEGLGVGASVTVILVKLIDLCGNLGRFGVV